LKEGKTMSARNAILELASRMSKVIIGQEQIVERLLIALLADGNVLVEGLPGLAKTRSVKSLALCLAAEFSRIQFTPDLLPSDITGAEILVGEGTSQTFDFMPGPIFSNIVLADEINRAPAKVQAALLEAMEERQVTVAGTTHQLPELFMVMATQNPIEQEGTYPLPEAQLDRFLLHVQISYPSAEAEQEILRLVRSEEVSDSTSEAELQPVPSDAVPAARAEIRKLAVAEAIDRYIVDLVHATRAPQNYSEDLQRWIHIGASPRGGIALDRAARVHAWLRGRDHVTPDDVRVVAHDCLRHRIILSYEAHAEGVTADEVLDKLLTLVAVG
jgi:MoxR-like ATPase